jgi:hypothetical protein
MTLDFQTNKKIAEEVAIIPSKRLRNKIAGFATHLMKRIQRGPVRGISLKLQEEERERRMDFVPEESAIKTDVIEVDRETIELLAALNMPQLPGVVQQVSLLLCSQILLSFLQQPHLSLCKNALLLLLFCLQVPALRSSPCCVSSLPHC